MRQESDSTTTKRGIGQLSNVFRKEAVPEIIKPSQVLLEWTAPDRFFKKHSREFYRKIAVIVIFSAFLLLIIKDFLLIGVLGIVFFVVYVFHTVPPNKVKHRITTNGIDYASEYVYKWDELDSFYVEKKEGKNVLVLNTKNPLPGRIFLILSNEVKPERVIKIVNEHISIVEKPEATLLDKMVIGISSRVNL